jgi:DUF917 family protein
MSFEITPADVSALALGSSVLACGGGGNAYYGRLVAQDLLERHGAVRVIDLDEMAADRLAVSPGIMGAPLVGIEKPTSLPALGAGFEAVRRSLGDRIAAFVAVEVGGTQSMLPLLLGALNRLPLLDGDGMGRAFPEAQMCTFLIYGMRPGVPFAMSDDHGLLWRAGSLPFDVPGAHFGGTGRLGRFVGLALERVFRRYCARKGGWIYFTATFDHASLKRTLVRGTMRLALDLGRAVERARAGDTQTFEHVLASAGGKLLFRGKIVDLERRFRGGYDWGTLCIEGVDDDRGRRAGIDFKNEYLILRLDDEVVLTVPDLVTLVETESRLPVTTEVVRPGLRVDVLGLPSTPLYNTPEALRVVGPRAFGYEIPFVPLSGAAAK